MYAKGRCLTTVLAVETGYRILSQNPTLKAVNSIGWLRMPREARPAYNVVEIRFRHKPLNG
jgi:hypothetical protein